jgi:hypothetical protein
MSRQGLIGIATLIVCAIAAATSAAAMAAPEFKNEKGTSRVAQEFEKGTSGVVVLYSKANKAKITCATSEELGGFFSSAVTFIASFVYKKCEGENRKGEKCGVGSKGKAAAEEIDTNTLEGRLVETEVGNETAVMFKPDGGKYLIELEGACLPANPARVEGTVFCESTPISMFQLTTEPTCAVNKEVQVIQKTTGGAVENLKMFAVAAALEWTETIEFKEKIKTT